MKRGLLRIVSVALCVGALLAIGYVLATRDREPQGVRMVENSAPLTELLQRRAQEREAEEQAAAQSSASGTVSLEPSADPAAELGWKPLQRTEMSEDDAAILFFTMASQRGKENPRKIFDPRAYYVNNPGFETRIPWGTHPDGGWVVRYSQAGFRNPYEPADPPPRFRVILCGDSHIEALVPYEETVAAVLEEELRQHMGSSSVEVLNAASGGYDFYNYLGSLENSLRWRPDVFLLVIYGGNDFVGVLPHHAYFERVALDIPPTSWWEHRVRNIDRARTGLMAQAFQQVLHFESRPQNAEFALDAAVRCMLEIDALARREGIVLVTAYLPPATDVRPQDAQPRLDDWIETLELSEEDLGITERLADRLIGEMRERGIQIHDLRPALREGTERLYWQGDLHLNTRGQEIVARELLPLLLEHIPER